MAHRNRWFTVLNSMVDLSMAMLNNQRVIAMVTATSYTSYDPWNMWKHVE